MATRQQEGCRRYYVISVEQLQLFRAAIYEMNASVAGAAFARR
jgi:hypothetical protein